MQLNKVLLRTAFPLFDLRMANAIIAQTEQLQVCRRARRYEAMFPMNSGHPV